MKIALFGATGGTGRCVLRDGLARGHAFSCLARRPEALPVGEFTTESDRLRLVRGDTEDRAAIAEVLAGCEAVILTLGPRTASRIPSSRAAPGTSLKR
jgi:putative NADH-flavin reductase